MQEHFEHRVCHRDWWVTGTTTEGIRSASSCSWPDVGGSWSLLTMACCCPFCPVATITTTHCQKDQVCHSLKVQNRKTLQENGLQLIPTGLGGGRICGRMWPVVGNSWKRWHFTPAQDSIPDHSSCPPTNIGASLPKKEIIWDSFGSLNWLSTVSEKHQDKEVAGNRIQAGPGSAALSPYTAGAWLALGPRSIRSSGGSCMGY